MKKYKFEVFQSFEIFGDPCTKHFTNRKEAEEYADELAQSLAENTSRFRKENPEHEPSTTGFDKEIEWERENQGIIDVEELKESILNDVIIIEEM